jgi:hypothetical protein
VKHTVGSCKQYFVPLFNYKLKNVENKDHSLKRQKAFKKEEGEEEDPL